MEIMDRSSVRKMTLVLTVLVLVPVICSCSLFKKKAVIKAATEFGDALRIGDASDILEKTDGLGLEFKKSFKALFDVESYTDEEMLYAAHMMDSIEVEIDSSSVKVDKNTATCDIEFTIADHMALQDGDYKDADALAQAVDNASTRTVKVTTQFELIEKVWYVTNFDDEGFSDLFSFLKQMPPIGRGTLIKAAEQTAKTVTSDDASLALSIAASVKSDDMVDMPAYLTALFDLNGDPSEEETAFRDAVKETMTYEIDESTLNIDGLKGTIVIRITMADYETLAGKEFKKIPEITDAVKECGTVTYSYTCELIRVGSDWFVTNLDSDEYAAFLGYKKFSINLKSVDGTYKATLDITDKFVAYVSEEFGIKMPSGLDGKIYISENLVLKKGQYEVTVDHDAYINNIKVFVENNIDKIIMNMLGTTSSLGLDTLAKLAGYADYADMRQQILDQVMTNIETINTSGLESSGTYTVNDNLITFKSSTDTFSGKLDNYGDLTVTSPINDPDARKLLGTDTVTLVFKKNV